MLTLVKIIFSHSHCTSYSYSIWRPFWISKYRIYHLHDKEVICFVNNHVCRQYSPRGSQLCILWSNSAHSCENYFSQFTLYIIQLGHMAAIFNVEIQDLSPTWHKKWYVSLAIMFPYNISLVDHNSAHSYENYFPIHIVHNRVYRGLWRPFWISNYSILLSKNYFQTIFHLYVTITGILWSNSTASC